MQDDTKRISRLTAILTQMQSQRLITATELANKFSVSVRTIYRDIRALEKAGIPVVTEEGKGYSLMDDYRLPAVMFTEGEANALIIAEQLVFKSKDASLIDDYSNAIVKIKSVLRNADKAKVNLLADRTNTSWSRNHGITSNNLSKLQFALTNFLLVKIEYTNQSGTASERVIEPFALLSTENWLLVAYCRLREEFRYFRADRIMSISVLPEKFEPHKMTLQQFFDLD